MDYAEYKKLKDEIEAERRKKLDALEMVWRMCQRGNGSSASEEPGRSGAGTKSDAIRRVIEGLSADFSADDVEQGLKDHNVRGIKRLHITNTLHRLVRRKELEVVKKGRGRMPGVYRKLQKMENI